MKKLKIILSAFLCTCTLVFADNQTPTLSEVLPETSLPFRVQIDLADFALPNGIHSFASACYDGKWLFIAGRTNGMHSFNADPNNFPPSAQNTIVYVVDPVLKTVHTASLTSPTSGLTQIQVDFLSVTSPQSYQSDKTLYVTGGYGVDTATGEFSTKPVLTAIDIPGIIHWVVQPSISETAVQHIRQYIDPFFQVTGGYMAKPSDNGPMLLVFGQNFKGFYFDPVINGIYTKLIKRFNIIDDGTHLSIEKLPSSPLVADPNYRRRDLNVIPTVHKKGGNHVKGLVALAGVFTETSGVWTVPVNIKANGTSSMADPLNPSTFKQAMNHYTSATLGMYSDKHEEMYTLLLGGISFGFYQGNVFQTDAEIPFINQVTTVKIDRKEQFSQYLMGGQYPFIPSTFSNFGNPLLFGAAAQFMNANDVHSYDNGVLQFDRQGKKPFVAGYIVGGIQSSVPNTSTSTDSAASPYIFKVTIIPVH